MMPFAGGVESTSNGALILSVAAALFYLFALDQPESWKRSAVKTLAVASLAVVAVDRSAPLLLVAALGLSAVGDLFLSREGERPFLAGLASFLAAHVAYVSLFYGIGEGVGAALEPWRAAVGVAILALTFAMLRVLMPRLEAVMRLPVVAYAAAILLMGLAALTTQNPAVMAGALLFMASDSLLAWEKFAEPDGSDRRKPMRVAVWVLYFAAQVLIALGVVLG